MPGCAFSATTAASWPPNTVAMTVVPANPGIFAGAGPDPRPALAYHSSSYATGVVSVDGTIKAGDIGSICIGSSTALTATHRACPTGCTGAACTTMSCRRGDSLASIQQAFIGHDERRPAGIGHGFERVHAHSAAGQRTPAPPATAFHFRRPVSTGAHLAADRHRPGASQSRRGGLLCCANTAGAAAHYAKQSGYRRRNHHHVCHRLGSCRPDPARRINIFCRASPTTGRRTITRRVSSPRRSITPPRMCCARNWRRG